MQERKERLLGLATEMVLLLAEVTLNLALLEELEVLLCREKRLVYEVQISLKCSRIQSKRARIFNLSICSVGETLSKKGTTETNL
jgi:hypothetical protein